MKKILSSAYTLPLFLVAIIVVFVYLFSSRIEGLIYDLLKRDDHLEPFKDNVDIDYSKGISKLQANQYAQQLFNAFNEQEPFTGTDEYVISEIFDRIDSNDFKKIYKEFGHVDYNGHSSPSEGIDSAIDFYRKRDLVYILYQELSPFWDKVLYNKVKLIVNEAGFVF